MAGIEALVSSREGFVPAPKRRKKPKREWVDRELDRIEAAIQALEAKASAINASTSANATGR
jgi:hypothetical protein